MLSKINSSFKGENLPRQYMVFWIDVYFHDYKHATEIDENGHSNRNIDYEIKRQKAVEQELGFGFIRIYPDKKHFDIFENINEILR